MPIVVKRDELPRTKHAHEFVGADHGEGPVSLIFVHAAPAAGPKLHRYPDAEVFVVESGHWSGNVRGRRRQHRCGGAARSFSDLRVPSGFVNSGTGELRLTAIHAAARFDTAWISDADATWATPRSAKR